MTSRSISGPPYAMATPRWCGIACGFGDVTSTLLVIYSDVDKWPAGGAQPHVHSATAEQRSAYVHQRGAQGRAQAIGQADGSDSQIHIRRAAEAILGALERLSRRQEGVGQRVV